MHHEYLFHYLHEIHLNKDRKQLVFRQATKHKIDYNANTKSIWELYCCSWLTLNCVSWKERWWSRFGSFFLMHVMMRYLKISLLMIIMMTKWIAQLKVLGKSLEIILLWGVSKYFLQSSPSFEQQLKWKDTESVTQFLWYKLIANLCVITFFVKGLRKSEIIYNWIDENFVYSIIHHPNANISTTLRTFPHTSLFRLFNKWLN